MQITDRSKDVIKSGGEWISSVDLENAAVGCAGVAEAAAIGVKHPKWDERPLLLVVRKAGSEVSADEIREHLAQPCRQMVAARRDPVRRQPAPHRHRQAAQDRAARAISGLSRWRPPERARRPPYFYLCALSRAHESRWPDRGGDGPAGASPARLEAVPARRRRRRLRPTAPHDVDRRLAAEWTALAAARGRAQRLRRALVRRRLAAAPWRAGRDVRLLEVRRGSRLIGLLPVEVETRLCPPAGPPSSRIGATTRCSSARRSSPRARRRPSGPRPSPRSTRPTGRRNFLHLRGLAEDGPVHRGLPPAPAHRPPRGPRLPRRATSRPQAYYERAVRQKKRKEIRRLRNRLAELGPVAARTLDDRADARRLVRRLSRAGEGRLEGRGRAARSPAGPRPSASSARRVAAAWDAGRLQFLRLDVGGRADRDAGQLPDARRAASRSRPCSTRIMPASRPAC